MYLGTIVPSRNKTAGKRDRNDRRRAWSLCIVVYAPRNYKQPRRWLIPRRSFLMRASSRETSRNGDICRARMCISTNIEKEDLSSHFRVRYELIRAYLKNHFIFINFQVNFAIDIAPLIYREKKRILANASMKMTHLYFSHSFLQDHMIFTAYKEIRMSAL